MKATQLPFDIHSETNPLVEAQRLYRLDPLWRGKVQHVLVSDALTLDQGPESMAFACDEQGYVSEYADLASHHPIDHEKVLRDLGVTEIVAL